MTTIDTNADKTVNFGDIEALLSQFEQTDNGSAALYSSIAWSFAMSAAQTMVRLQRVFNPEDPIYSTKSVEIKTETTQRLELIVDNALEMLGWAARSANPDFMPTGVQVAQLCTETLENPPLDPEIANMLALEMGVSANDLTLAHKSNEQRNKQEQELQVATAKTMQEEIAAKIDFAIKHNPGSPDAVLLPVAIKICNKVADKAADYKVNRLAFALRQKRAKRRDEALADRLILSKIEEAAEDLLTRYEREYNNVFNP